MTTNINKANNLNIALQKSTGATIEQIAKDNNVSTIEVVQCLPGDEATFISGKLFEAAMDNISSWGAITFITNANNVVLEVKGPLPKGTVSHGHYNIHGPEFGSHIELDHCTDICFVSRQLFGRDSHSVQFFNVEGNCMFKIYLGRDKSNEILPGQITKFTQLKSQLCSTDTPAKL